MADRPTPTDAPARPATAEPARWWGLMGLCIGVFMFTLDSSIVNVALPTLVTTLQTTFVTVQWVVVAYLLIATTLVMAAAQIGDRVGRKRGYLFGLALFTFGSLLCGLSPSVGWLIAFRSVQGLGAVFVSALGAALVGQMFPPQSRGRAMGTIGSAVLLGVALGPSLGGFIIEHAGWRWIFLVNIPVGIAAFLTILRFVPDGADRGGQALDWQGTLLTVFLLSALTFAITLGQSKGFSSPAVLTLLAAAALGLYAFLRVEARTPYPMLDLGLLRNGALGSGLLISGLMFFVLGGTGFLMPFYLETVAGYSTDKVGMLMAISPLLGGIAAPLGGTLADRLGARRMTVTGVTLVALGCLSFATADADITVWGFALRVAPIGVGMGLFNAANNSGVLNAVPAERLSIASALLSLMRTLGQTTGVPVIASIFALSALARAGSQPHAALLDLPPTMLVHGVHMAFVAAAAIALCAAAIGARHYVRRRVIVSR